MITYPSAAGGVLTRVFEAGEGGDPVLFIHGAGARSDRWARNLPVLARQGFHCYAIDLPGHGFAQKGEGFDYGVPGFTDFVGRWLDERGLERVRIVGTSLGGHIAATVTCRWPERVRSLVLVGATGLFPVGATAAAAIAGRIVDRSREGIRRKLQSVIFDPALVTERLVDEEYAINNSPGAAWSFEALARYFRAGLDDDAVGERLAGLGNRVPTLLIWGQEDRSVPLSVGRSAAALLRDVPLEVIPLVAHAPYFEDADRFNALVAGFFVSAH